MPRAIHYKFTITVLTRPALLSATLTGPALLYTIVTATVQCNHSHCRMPNSCLISWHEHQPPSLPQVLLCAVIINNNNRRLVTLAEHTSDHGRQTNSSTEEKGNAVLSHIISLILLINLHLHD